MSKIKLHFGGYQGPYSVHSRAISVFRETLEISLGNDLDFTHSLNIMDMGRPASDLINMVSSGELTFCYFSSSYLADKVREFQLLDLPFMIQNREQAYAIFDGPLGQFLADKIDEVCDFRVLSWWDNGFRHFSNRLRPIRNPDDCVGLIIRSLRSDIYKKTYSSLGFKPVYLDVSKLKNAVESGKVDAQENALSNIFNFGINNHHRCITLSQHFFGPAVVLCHKKTYDSWPIEVRKIVNIALKKATDAQRRFASAEEKEVLQKFDLSNNEIITLGDDQRLEFVSTVKPVIESTISHFRGELFDFFSV